MLIRVDPTSPVPLATQIAAQVRGQLADGSVRPGARLPAARDLAASLDVNMHTVLRAYAELRDEGLIELRRGRGAVVAEGANADRADLHERARDLVRRGRRIGLTIDDLLDLVRKADR